MCCFYISAKVRSIFPPSLCTNYSRSVISQHCYSVDLVATSKNDVVYNITIINNYLKSKDKYHRCNITYTEEYFYLDVNFPI